MTELISAPNESIQFHLAGFRCFGKQVTVAAASVDQQVAVNQQVKAGFDSTGGLAKAGYASSGRQVADFKSESESVDCDFCRFDWLYRRIISVKLFHSKH